MARQLGSHGLLSAAAKAQTPESLAAYTLVAEAMLAVDQLAVGAQEAIVLSAVALQVNVLVALDPRFGLISSTGRGQRSTGWVTGVAPLDSKALALLDRVTGWPGVGSDKARDTTAWPTVRSARPTVP